jgi:thiol-disulfide isomerase/thioredoxin
VDRTVVIPTVVVATGALRAFPRRRSRQLAESRAAEGSRSARRGVLASIGALLFVLALVAIDGGQPSGRDDGVHAAFIYFDGSEGSFDDFDGSPVVVNFWASWCPACVAELPTLAEAHARYGDRVAFLGMNMQEVDLAAAMSLAAESGITYPLAHDPDGAIFLGFGGLAMPTTVFLGADGSVVLIHPGVLFAADLAEIIERELLG